MTKLQIGVMGGAFCYTPEALDAAYRIGKEIAKDGATLITGGTTGIPYQAAQGAKEVGGVSVGISPAVNRKEHVEKFSKPTDAYDILIFTGMGYAGRNPINIRSCDGIIYIGGEAGTLNEFTNGLYEARVLGVLEGIGGITDRIRTLMPEFQ
ncbi:MAG: protein containing YHS domain protein, partial [Nanoarchaeota archaeon]|nr:protein containing YHS domain protein [Nanoarchaeota archaeon]